MFRKYGILGIILILLVQLNFFFNIEPFARWYFPLIWFGYIFLIDAITYKLKNHSLLMNKPKQLLLMLILSSLVWWMFEYVNYVLRNWQYVNIDVFTSKTEVLLFSWLSFATVIPAVFETVDLLRTIHLFDNVTLKRKHNITKRFLYSMIGIGIVASMFIMLFPKQLFPFIWVSFYFILDPLNYLHKQPSIIQHLKDRKLAIPLTLFIAGIGCGVLWEFWNFWALPKWVYVLPAWTGPKLFEMPLWGYLGYGPFAWELYAMYYFVRNLFSKKKKEFFT